LAALLFGLRNIEHSDAADAAGWLEQVVKAQPSGRYVWMADLKSVAQKYLDDCKLYLDWKKEGENAKDPAAAARHLENTRAITQNKKFKTRTPFSDELSAQEKSLSRQLDDQRKTEAAKRNEQQKKQAEQATQDVARKRPQWLADWKNRLVDDLNQMHFQGEIVDITGVKYSGIDAATPQALTVKIGAYGTAQKPWAQIPPQALLAISRTFIKTNAPDTADREWLCAVFANEIGQTEDAKRLGGEAAKVKPEYAQMLPALLQRSGR
jgi:hypothetical protein